jgi:hypothetical protein
LSGVGVVHGGLEVVASDEELFHHSDEANGGGYKIIRTRGEAVYGKVEIIHGGGNASDAMHVLIHGGFIVEVEPKTKWSAPVVKLAMAEMKSFAADKLHPPCNKPNEIVPR